MSNEKTENSLFSVPEELATGFMSKFGDKLENVDDGTVEKTPEELAAEAAELGGTGFDDEGNLLDESGEIIKTKEELVELVKKYC